MRSKSLSVKTCALVISLLSSLQAFGYVSEKDLDEIFGSVPDYNQNRCKKGGICQGWSTVVGNRKQETCYFPNQNRICLWQTKTYWDGMKDNIDAIKFCHEGSPSVMWPGKTEICALVSKPETKKEEAPEAKPTPPPPPPPEPNAPQWVFTEQLSLSPPTSIGANDNRKHAWKAINDARDLFGETKFDVEELAATAVDKSDANGNDGFSSQNSKPQATQSNGKEAEKKNSNATVSHVSFSTSTTHSSKGANQGGGLFGDDENNMSDNGNRSMSKAGTAGPVMIQGASAFDTARNSAPGAGSYNSLDGRVDSTATEDDMVASMSQSGGRDPATASNMFGIQKRGRSIFEIISNRYTKIAPRMSR